MKYSCIGIDGFKGKWIAVYISDEGFEVRHYDTISDICQAYPNCDTYLIDMPIGLVESVDELRPDLLVKKELGKKGSSIFQVPCRQAVYAQEKARAREMNIEVLGKSLSEQTLGIARGIRQVDEFLQEKPMWKNKLLESHPEFCFAKLNRGIPVFEHKSSLDGQKIRMEILSKYYFQADKVIEKYRANFPRRKKLDDVIDALCLAVIGKEIVENGMQTIPAEPQEDRRGLLMQIVYTSLNKSYMLKELAKKYYQNGYNCAEAMLLAGNDYYQLGLSADTFKAMAGFGGGVGVEDLCGVISGSTALLGVLLVDSRASGSGIIKEATVELVERFREKMSSLNCKELKDLYREEEAKCSSVVEAGGEILEAIVRKYTSS